MNKDIMDEYRSKLKQLLIHLVKNPILTDKEKVLLIGFFGDTALKSIAMKNMDIDPDDYTTILIPECKLEIVTKILAEEGVSSLHEHEKRSQ